jgi:hypothetical protein
MKSYFILAVLLSLTSPPFCVEDSDCSNGDECVFIDAANEIKKCLMDIKIKDAK